MDDRSEGAFLEGDRKRTRKVTWLSRFGLVRRGRITIHRRSRVRLGGAVCGDGSLSFGVQWAGRFHRESHLVIRRGGTLRVDGAFSIYSGATVTIAEDATLSLGSGYINGDASISCFLNVRIGHGVAIGPELMLIDDDRHQLSGTSTSAGPINIGDHVWLGSRVTILKGTTIGDGAVVAAGSVVTRDVPAGELWGGVPARFIRAVAWT